MKTVQPQQGKWRRGTEAAVGAEGGGVNDACTITQLGVAG